MREINIAKVITLKRKQKGVTQDELAEYIGVSKASVSKWETAQSYPDITLLPHLAAYFNISIDELIGYLPQMTKEDIDKTYRRLAVNFSHKPFNEVIDETYTIIKKYYACFPLLYRMAVLLLNHCNLEKDKEKQKKLLCEVIELCTHIKRESDDVWLAKQANSLEAVSYLSREQPLEVLELLDGTIRPILSDDILLATAYSMTGKADKAKSVLQISLYQYLNSFISAAISYLRLIPDQTERFDEALKRFLIISDAFELEKLNPNAVCNLYYAGAMGYVIQNNSEMTLKMLEEYAHICTTYLLPLKFKGDAFFDDIDGWLSENDIEPPRDEKSIKESILQSVTENPAFIPLHEEYRYKSIVEKFKLFLGGK